MGEVLAAATVSLPFTHRGPQDKIIKKFESSTGSSFASTPVNFCFLYLCFLNLRKAPNYPCIRRAASINLSAMQLYRVY